jgi:hypothetical protein
LVEQLCFCSKTTASSDFDTSLTGSATTTVSELTLLYFLEQQQLFHLISISLNLLTNSKCFSSIVGLALSNSFTVIPYFLAIEYLDSLGKTAIVVCSE